MPKAKLTAARGASLSRQSIVAKLRRDRSNPKFLGVTVAGYTLILADWVNGQSLRAAKKPGGLGEGRGKRR